MRIILLLSIFFAFLSLVFGSPKEVSIDFNKFDLMNFGLTLTDRIVNGMKARSGQFPHQVSFRRSWSKQLFCAGNIISAKLVLTAAHCMFWSGNVLQPWTILVVGGTLKLDEKSSTRQEREVIGIRLHAEFNFKTMQNDIALLELSVPFNFTSELHSAILPRKPPRSMVCQVSGWGYLSFDNPTISNDLMYVDLPILSTKKCRILLDNITDVPEGMFCAGWLNGGKDSCQGDSGGGMICNGVLTGIVSAGIGCALPRLPAIYTDIFHYMNWIIEDKNVVMIEKYITVSSGNAQSKLPMITIMTMPIFCALCRLRFDYKVKIL